MPQPLTDAEKATIRLYLGYQARFHSTDTSLEMALRALDLPDNVAAYNQVTDPTTGLLAYIADIDSKLKATNAVGDQVEQVATIKLNPPQGLALLRSRGRMYCARLASLLGVPVRMDYFGSAHPRGPFWGLAGTEYGGGAGGGNLPRLG